MLFLSVFRVIEKMKGKLLKMNKAIVVNCKNFKCNRNDKGECKLSHISLASDGGLIVSKLICEDAEPIPEPEEK